MRRRASYHGSTTTSGGSLLGGWATRGVWDNWKIISVSELKESERERERVGPRIDWLAKVMWLDEIGMVERKDI